MNYIFYIFLISILLYHTNRYFHRTILYLLGFKINENSLKNLPSRLILISTHTSVYDFFIGMFIYYGYLHQKYDNYILMKKSFEKYTTPFVGLLDNKLKLIEVDKEKKGLVSQIVDEIKYKDNFVIYISPEGTRKYIDNLRSGYWVISKELNIDVCFIGIDFFHKTIYFESPRKVQDHWIEEKENFEKVALEYAPLFPENCHFYKSKLD